MLRDTNLLAIAANDTRRLEIVARGLPLYRGVPLGVDSTMAAPLHANGLPWRHADTCDGIAIKRAEKKKKDTYPELVGSNRLRLTTLACETSGRWSEECVKVVRLLARAKARTAREEQRARMAAAYASRWWSMLSVSAQMALASTLVDEKPRCLDGVDGEEPHWQEVLQEAQDTSLLPDEARSGH